VGPGVKPAPSNPAGGESRRSFLKKTTAATAALTGVAATANLWPAYGGANRPVMWIVSGPDDAVAKLAPVQWALQHFRDVLARRGVLTELGKGLDAVPAEQECLLLAGAAGPTGPMPPRTRNESSH
jgi:hypothetical protein